jgi:hypothetical protein
LRTALRWLADAGEGELGLRLESAAGALCSTRGYMTEEERWVEAALQRARAAAPIDRPYALARRFT